MVEDPVRHAGDGIDLRNAVDLITEELHADGFAGPVGGVDLHRIAADAEVISDKVQIVALIADLDELFDQLIPFPLLTGTEGDDHIFIVDGVTQTVDAGHGSHHDDIPPLKEGGGGAVAQALDLIVDGGVLFDIGVRVGDVGFRLIVIVVTNEIFHGIVGEDLAEFGAELRREGLVMRQHQCGAVGGGDDISHGIGLAGTGDTQQNLLLQAHIETVYQLADGLRLIARGLIGCLNFEIHSMTP